MTASGRVLDPTDDSSRSLDSKLLSTLSAPISTASDRDALLTASSAGMPAALATLHAHFPKPDEVIEGIALGAPVLRTINATFSQEQHAINNAAANVGNRVLGQTIVTQADLADVQAAYGTIAGLDNTAISASGIVSNAITQAQSKLDVMNRAASDGSGNNPLTVMARFGSIDAYENWKTERQKKGEPITI
jgi:hypothetical protein